MKPSNKNGLPELEPLRQAINETDQKILALVNERLDIAQKIGAIKQGKGLPVVDFSRERAVLNKLQELNEGPMPDETLLLLYTEIIAASRRIQQPLEVGYLGPKATFTHMAAMKHFGRSTNFTPLATISDVFEEVDKRRRPFGVVPVENSMEGAVNLTLDLFQESDVRICGEIYLPIRHDLLSAEDSLDQIMVVFSHPQAIAQCRKWLGKNLPGILQNQCSSTSEAARMAVNTPGGAAIASSEAAITYELNTLADNIQDSTTNITRFLVIGRDKVQPTGRDKTSLLFAIPHIPGALHSVLQPISEEGLNMVKLESRPSKSASWHYLFFVDLEGHMKDEPVKKVVDKMRSLCSFVKWMGSYPVGDRP
ncbi:prephenate dehydratase [Desulfatibacillum aliphaticivorans]|uniref:prephenate dehydratase n=1 Tax=Desulfatibacillum aliphaticivorans TaxID=218208 RepID=UPI00041ADE45|nr:prephenate dehydratase [Desulfatibacillum aliphaticivorans]